MAGSFCLTWRSLARTIVDANSKSSRERYASAVIEIEVFP